MFSLLWLAKSLMPSFQNLWKVCSSLKPENAFKDPKLTWEYRYILTTEREFSD